MQIIINIINTFFTFLVLSVSFYCKYISTKYFDLAHAVVITLGGYFTLLIFRQVGLSLWVAVPVAVIMCIIVGMLMEVILYKPLRKRNTSPLLMLIASLGLYVVLQNCISMVWGDDTKIIRTGDVAVGNEIFGAYITNIQITTIVVSLVLLILTLLFLKYNKIGRNIRAVSANSELANIVGINSDRVILWAFGIGSGMAAIAGILVASDTGLTPTMGFNLLLYGVVAMIIGGVGSTKGLIGGALLLATAQHLTAYYIDSKWMDAITYIILILFLIWKPLGFSGKRLKKIEI